MSWMWEWRDKTPKRPRFTRIVGVLATLTMTTLAEAKPPADDTLKVELPPGLVSPPRKKCLEAPSGEGLSDDEMVSSVGLTMDQIQGSIDKILPKLAQCVKGAPPRDTAWFDITVRCNGRVSDIEVVESGDWPALLVACVRGTLRFTDFPAHGLPDGEIFQQPVGFVGPGQSSEPEEEEEKRLLLSGREAGSDMAFDDADGSAMLEEEAPGADLAQRSARPASALGDQPRAPPIPSAMTRSPMHFRRW